MSAKAKNWVDKLRGWLQREDESGETVEAFSNSPAQELKSATPEPEPVTPTTINSVSENPRMQPNPINLHPRPQPALELRKVMAGDSREQADWAFRQIAFVGQELMKLAKQANLPAGDDLGHDFALLKIGYALTSLAFRSQQTHPSLEATRNQRATIKGALLAALRKDYHRHAVEENKLGASMISLVEQELNALEADVSTALENIQAKTGSPCQIFIKHLSPAFGSEAELAASPQMISAIDGLYLKICKSMRFDI